MLISCLISLLVAVLIALIFWTILEYLLLPAFGVANAMVFNLIRLIIALLLLLYVLDCLFGFGYLRLR